MTIKHRLIISNILMIVIPVLISAIIIGAGQYISYEYWKNQYDKTSSVYDVPDKIISVATELIRDPRSRKAAEKQQLEAYCKKIICVSPSMIFKPIRCCSIWAIPGSTLEAI